MTTPIQAVAAFCVALLPGVTFGQDMCVPDPVEVGRVEGIVLFEAGGKASPLPDVTIAISPYTGRNAPAVASSVSGSDGHFSISDIAPGRYWLSMRHKVLIGYATELRVETRNSRVTAFLIATIRNDPNKPCGGGSVQLSPVLSESCRSMEYQDQNQVDYGPLNVRRIEGFARDMESTPVPGTCVGVFTEQGHRLVSRAETDKNGWFALGTVKPGRYRLVAKYDSFGVANVLLDVAAWPSGGIFHNRALAVHLRPRNIDTTSFVDRKQ
jgi:hypothetical protein